jgi:cell division protein FtsB
MFDLSFIKKSVASLAQQVQQLRTDIEKLQREREDILTAPATRDDIKTMAAAWCEERSAKYGVLLRGSLQVFIRKPALMQDRAKVAERMTCFGSVGQLNGIIPGPGLTDMAMCALLGPALVKSLHATIDAMEDWPANALPMAGRSERVDALDKKITKLTREESDMVAEARAAGVIFE